MLNLLERLWVCKVKYCNSALASVEELLRQARKLLHSCGIPNFQADSHLVDLKFDRFKVTANRYKTVLFKVIVDESVHNTRFSSCTHAYKDDLELAIEVVIVLSVVVCLAHLHFVLGVTTRVTFTVVNLPDLP